MFSFGIVCVYAITQRVIFAVEKSELEKGVKRQAVVLERQISYFSDEDGMNGLFRHFGEESPWPETFRTILGGFGPEQPLKPLALWEGQWMDADLRIWLAD